ncbi:YEATS domain-containing protein 2 [Ischnura elegans]|uniref:YEATS domain-containing protein 2 n=1 Tax=Ischnura elegans TaxID=197161 RepID=UPI001ED893D3|nr:YEATS domain-containing protein 2 [Ischnura elegans]
MSELGNRKRRRSEDETDNRSNDGLSDSSEVPDTTLSKALAVIRREFKIELRKREQELETIDERLKEALRIQHLLRYAVVSSYYGMRTSQGEWPDASNTKHLAHPAVAGLSRKKKPKRSAEEKLEESNACDSDGPSEEKGNVEDESNLPTKIPCYIPPVTKKGAPEPTSPTRGFHTKRRYRIIVGNVSRWIPVDCREDGASHKWMVYARCPPNETPFSQFVTKVRFFLHPSYRPFDVVEVTSPPFRLSRRGWGEFPVRVQVHFRNPLNKPIDIIHHLILDKTKSGRQVLGSETVVEGWMFVDDDGRSDGLEDGGRNQDERDWKENSSRHHDGEDTSGMGEEDSGSGLLSSIKKEREEEMSWETSGNISNVFNECTLMSDEDIKEEIMDEESNSEDDMRSCPSPAENEGVEHGNSVSETNSGVGTGVLDQVFVKKEPLSEDEQNVEEEIVIDHKLVKEEFIVGGMTEECGVSVNEEVVIEEGYFPVPVVEDSIIDISSCVVPNNDSVVTGGVTNLPKSGEQTGKSQVPAVKVEKNISSSSISISSSLLRNASGNKSLSLVPHNEVKQSLKPKHPFSAGSTKGLLTGKSLLKNPSIRPGTSLLLQLPSLPGAARTIPQSTPLAFKTQNQSTHQPNVTPSLKPAVDVKAAIYARNYSKLKTRLHEDREAATSHLLKALPIVTSLACDPAYRALHHYAANSLEEFFNWPLAKQRASEWIRAGEVRKLLLAQGFNMEEENAWTTKDIMMWARLRGFTPLSPKVPHTVLEHSAVAVDTTNTFSEPIAVNNWLSSHEKERPNSMDGNENDNEEIDVVNIGGPPKKANSLGNQRTGLGARAAAGQKVILLGMEQSLGDLSHFVDEFSRKIGVVSSCPEEIIPCVFYPAAKRILIEAVKSFMNDLVRGSYSFALKRTCESSGMPMTIKVEDIRKAVLNRQEFDILTNEGLSTEPDESLKWDGPV